MYPIYEEIRGEMRARGLESLISDVYLSTQPPQSASQVSAR